MEYRVRTRNLCEGIGEKVVRVAVSGRSDMETSNFEFLYAKLGGRHVECFVGIVPTIVLSGHSLNLVQPFSRGDKNKLLLCFCKTAFLWFLPIAFQDLRGLIN